MKEINWMQQGWECPKCGAVMSPTTSVCVNCRGDSNSSATALNGFFTEQQVANTFCKTEADHEWECDGVSTEGSHYTCRKCYASKFVICIKE